MSIDELGDGGLECPQCGAVSDVEHYYPRDGGYKCPECGVVSYDEEFEEVGKGTGFDDMGEGEAGDFGITCFICDWEGTGTEAAAAGGDVDMRCPECGAYLESEDAD